MNYDYASPEGEPAPGLQPPRQRRSEETLARIVAATEELVAEEGLEAATIKAVMMRSGVGQGSLYARFSGREALLAHVQDRFWSQLREALTEAAEADAAGGRGREPLEADRRPDEVSHDPRGMSSARERVRRWAGRLLSLHAEHEAPLRAYLVHALTDPAGRAMERIVAFDEAVAEALRAAVAGGPADRAQALGTGGEPERPTGAPPAAEDAASRAFVALAWLRMRLLFPDSAPPAAAAPAGELAERLTDMVMRHEEGGTPEGPA